MCEKGILQNYLDELASGLKDNKININDIENMIGDAIEQFKTTLTDKTTEIISENKALNTETECHECGRSLKKTEKQTNQ